MKAKAKAADDKYSKSVLADLVRREKDKDRAEAADKPTTLKSVPASPEPERPNAAVASAVNTAARKTAAAAGVRAPRTRRTTTN